MGLGLYDLDGYPPGISAAHPHFYDEQIECPSCGETTVVGPECEHCGTALNDDTIRDQLEDQRMPPEWA
jgi:methionyl-tRNA synthetase